MEIGPGEDNPTSDQIGILQSEQVPVNQSSTCMDVGSVNQSLNMKKKRGSNHKCLQCGKDFPTPSKLQRHSVIHTGKKSFACDLFPEGLKQQVHLRQHRSREHGKISTGAEEAEKPLDEWTRDRKLFNCHICKYSTNIKDNIEAHYMATHNISRNQAVAGMLKEISSEDGTNPELRGTEGSIKTSEVSNGVVQIVPESILLKEEEVGDGKNAIPTLNLPSGTDSTSGTLKTEQTSNESPPLTTWSPLPPEDPLIKCDQDEFENKPSNDVTKEGMELDMMVEYEADIKREESKHDEEILDTKHEANMDGEYDLEPQDYFKEDVNLKEDLWENYQGELTNTNLSVSNPLRNAKNVSKDAKIKMLEEANMQLRKKVHTLQTVKLRLRKRAEAKKTPKENTVKLWVKDYITKHRSAT